MTETSPLRISYPISNVSPAVPIRFLAVDASQHTRRLALAQWLMGQWSVLLLVDITVDSADAAMESGASEDLRTGLLLAG